MASDATAMAHEDHNSLQVAPSEAPPKEACKVTVARSWIRTGPNATDVRGGRFRKGWQIYAKRHP
eukprot:2197971-Pyramimonas_sp.AAC.1